MMLRTSASSISLLPSCLLALMLLMLGPVVAHAQTEPLFRSVENNPYGLTGVGGNDSAPSVADLDGDGDLDVLTGERDGTLNFYENTAGAGNIPTFAALVENPFGLTRAGGNLAYAIPAVADLDGDGDQDVLVGLRSGAFRYYRNTAGAGTTPAFAAPQDNPFG
ncbi:MAG TPA: FG-GAP-like repeat-containing protein, partial [Rhodothermales bacterium]|nr:FG-GAP-like repeat-containing protein [Rhodothermales bacterium]